MFAELVIQREGKGGQLLHSTTPTQYKMWEVQDYTRVVWYLILNPFFSQGIAEEESVWVFFACRPGLCFISSFLKNFTTFWDAAGHFLISCPFGMKD